MNRFLWLLVLCWISLSGCWFVPIPGTGWGLVGVPLPASRPVPRPPARADLGGMYGDTAPQQSRRLAQLCGLPIPPSHRFPTTLTGEPHLT